MALFLILAVVLVGILALTVDVGLIHTARREAQVAADSAALAAAAYVPTSTTEATAAAIEFAGYNAIDGTPITSSCVEVQFGTWSTSLGVFTPAATPGNSVRVTIRRDATHAGPVPLTFGRILNQTGFNVSRSAIAMTTPRDIIFLIDVSGSMNNDTEPCWATTVINNAYTNVGTQAMQQVYTDMGFGTFPGTSQFVGQGLTGIVNDGWNYAEMTKNGGPLSATTIPTTYRIVTTDTEATRKTKAYRWIIDYQLKTLMPQAKPLPDSVNAASLAFWSLYLDYVVFRQVVTSTSAKGRPRPALPVSLPPSATIQGINNTTLGNPFILQTTTASTTEVASYRNNLGYRTYTQFMADFDKDEVVSGTRTQLSVLSPNCVYHNETIDGVSFSMPPSEQPMHAIRRALISTINLIKSRNQNVGDSNQQDRVGILAVDAFVRTSLDVALTTNYDSVRNFCRTLQAINDLSTTTNLDGNITFASQQLMPSAQGRAYARKIIVVISDSYVTRTGFSNAQIDAYQSQYPYPEYGWFHAIAPPAGVTDPRYEPNSSIRYARNGALMAAHQGYATGVESYAVKVGFSSNQAIMDALADFGGTANTANEAPIVTNNPSLYESRIKAVLADIIDNPRGRLVQ